jgi:uncharacterized protein
MKRTKILYDSKKGRGVFADENISKGEVIEICHLIVLNFSEVGNFLEGYVFEYSAKKAALALGNGSLYNHSDKANAKCFMDTQKNILFCEAKKSIKKDEEITINYGYSKSDREKFHIV